MKKLKIAFLFPLLAIIFLMISCQKEDTSVIKNQPESVVSKQGKSNENVPADAALTSLQPDYVIKVKGYSANMVNSLPMGTVRVGGSNSGVVYPFTNSNWNTVGTANEGQITQLSLIAYNNGNIYSSADYKVVLEVGVFSLTGTQPLTTKKFTFSSLKGRCSYSVGTSTNGSGCYLIPSNQGTSLNIASSFPNTGVSLSSLSPNGVCSVTGYPYDNCPFICGSYGDN